MAAFWVVAPCDWYMFTNITEVCTASIIRAIALMMEAGQTSVTLVNSYQSALRYNPEESHLHSDRRENRKS
jgi:methylase of polypeptide subunit release factors